MVDCEESTAGSTRLHSRLRTFISIEMTVTEEERILLDYYVNELSREFLSDGPSVRIRMSESAAIKSPAGA